MKLTDIASALESVIPNSTLLTGVPKPEIYFMREGIVAKSSIPTDVISVDDVIVMSDSIKTFYENVAEHFSSKNIEQIEILTRGQCSNESSYAYRKGVITASKAHEVKTKMEKFLKGGTSEIFWELFKKISGLVFISPDIPALKYGQSMEINAVIISFVSYI